ncbi:MAG: hypothetical protein AAF682_17905 [Planctomycetota bacterium]
MGSEPRDAALERFYPPSDGRRAPLSPSSPSYNMTQGHFAARLSSLVSFPLSLRVGAAAALSAAALAGTSSLGGPGAYSGQGFVVPTLHQNTVQEVLEVDLGDNGLSEIVTLDTSGELIVNFDALSTGWTGSLTGYTDMAVTRAGDRDRLWALGSNGIVEIVGSSFTADADPLVELPTGVTATNPTAMRSFEVGGGTGIATHVLTVIDHNGLRLRTFDTAPAQPQLLQSYDSVSGVFHDAVAVDWHGQNEVAVAAHDDTGLRLLEADGFVPPDVLYPAQVAGAALELLPGGNTQWGHDLVLFKHSPSGGGPAGMVVANAVHTEVVADPTNYIGEIRTGNFLGGSRDDVLLVDNGAPFALLMKQQFTRNESAPILFFDYKDTFLIDFSKAIPRPSEGSDGPPPVVTASVSDCDGDGDEDIIAVDSLQQLIVLPSNTVLEDLVVRPWVNPLIEPTIVVAPPAQSILTYASDVELPPGADQLGVDVWEQTAGDPVLVGVEGFTPSAGSSIANVSFSFPLTASTGQVFALRFRALAGGLELQSWVGYWSNDAGTLASLAAETSTVYPWSTGDDGGGIARRPRLSPPVPTVLPPIIYF